MPAQVQMFHGVEGVQDHPRQPQAQPLQEEGKGTPSLGGGTAPQEQAPDRAGGRLLLDHVRQAVPQIPSQRSRQGPYGLCPVCHVIQPPETIQKSDQNHYVLSIS